MYGRGWAQYCPLNDPYGGREDEAAGRSPPARPQAVIAHFALHPTGVDALAAGIPLFLQKFLEYRHMKCLLLPWGE